MDSLKNYQILEQLGKGSYGIVHKIKKKSDNEILVLKQINIKNMNSRARSDAMNEVLFFKLGKYS
jgi:serine/threonine protein kinase